MDRNESITSSFDAYCPEDFAPSREASPRAMNSFCNFRRSTCLRRDSSTKLLKDSPSRSMLSASLRSSGVTRSGGMVADFINTSLYRNRDTYYACFALSATHLSFRPSILSVMSPYLIDRHSRESGNPVPSGAYVISMDTRFRGYDEGDEWDFCALITTGDIALIVAGLMLWLARPIILLPRVFMYIEACVGERCALASLVVSRSEWKWGYISQRTCFVHGTRL